MADITPLSQRDPRWKDILLGFNVQKTYTIGNFGCFITSIAMLIGTTPDVVNRRLKEAQGFVNGGELVWGVLEKALPGVKLETALTPYDNEAVKANVPCFVMVDGTPIGAPMHAVVYIGNQKMIDPWTGQIEPTSKYKPLKYAVIRGKYTEDEKPQPKPQAQPNPMLDFDTHLNQKIKDASRVKFYLDDRRRVIDDLVKFEEELKKEVVLKNEAYKAAETVRALYDKTKAELEEVRIIHREQIQEERARYKDLEAKLKAAQKELDRERDRAIKLEDKIAEQKERITALDIEIAEIRKTVADQKPSDSEEIKKLEAQRDELVEKLTNIVSHPAYIWYERIIRFLPQKKNG